MARAVRSEGMVLHGDRGCDHLGCDRVSPVLPPSQGLGGVLDATSGIVTPTRAIGQATQLRVLDRNQMAGGAQANRTARYAGRARLQPEERALRRPVPAAGRGCGLIFLSVADRGRRA